MYSERIIGGVLGALLLIGAPLAGAGTNSFTLTGPEGAYVSAIAVQPGHPNVVLAGTSRGIYRSTDAGVTWTLGSSQYAESMVFDAGNSDRVFALNGQLYVSNDAGLSFAASPGSPPSLSEIAVSGSHLYVASYTGTVSRSDDGGQTWTSLTVPWSGTSSQVGAIAADPANDGVLYVCVSTRGTYKTSDRGVTWIAPAVGSPCSGQFDYAWSYAVSPVDPNRVLAATSNGLYLSTNGGAGWNNLIPAPSAEWIYFDPAAPNNVMAVGQIGSIALSTDGGSTWPGFIPWPTLLHSRMTGAAFSGVAGHIYIATYSGPLYSGDSGASFSLRVAGMHAGSVKDIVAADDGTIYAMQDTGPSGLFRRIPGGWAPLDNDELRTRPNNELRFASIATAAEDSSLVYVIQADQLYRSNNRGVDWNDPPASIRRQPSAVAVDPTNSRKAWLSTYSGSVMRTTDGGVTFSDCAAGNQQPLDSMKVDRAAPNIIYGIGSYSPYNRLYKSVDGCITWQALTANAPYAPNDLAIDPANHDKIYLAQPDGVLRSRDGGTTWTPLNFGAPFGESFFAMRLLIDPVEPTTLWVPSLSISGFARSVDDGVTWQQVTAPTSGGNLGLYNGVLDPLSPDTLVAGTRGFGLVEYQVAPDLEALLDVPQGPLPAGANTTATVRVHNLGPLDASSPDVTLAVPSSWSVSNLPGNCASSGGTVRCHLAPVHVDETLSVPLVLTPSAAAATIDLTATVTGHEADPAGANNTVTRALTVTRQVDLGLALTANPTTVDRGATTRFTVTATNRGPTPATGTSLMLDLHDFAVATIQTSRGPCTILGPSAVCVLGALASGDATTLQFDGAANTAGNLTLSGTLSDDTGEFRTAGSVAITSRPVGDLSVTVTDSADPVVRSTDFQYTATLKQVSGDTAASQFSATVTGATVSAATSPGGACTIATGTVSCTLSAMAAGESTTVSITVSAAAAGNAGITATATYAGTDPVATNNSATATTVISNPPPPPGSSSSSGGGKGGGGRFDWVALGLLGALLPGRRYALARRAISGRSSQR